MNYDCCFTVLIGNQNFQWQSKFYTLLKKFPVLYRKSTQNSIRLSKNLYHLMIIFNNHFRFEHGNKINKQPKLCSQYLGWYAFIHSRLSKLKLFVIEVLHVFLCLMNTLVYLRKKFLLFKLIF